MRTQCCRRPSGTCVTDYYNSLQIDARNRLASCCALAILSRARAGVPRPYDEVVGQDLRADAGIVEQGYFSRPECSARARRPDRLCRPYSAHLPRSQTGARVWKKRRTEALCGSGTCCGCPRGGEEIRRRGAVDFPLEVRRSICRNRVNSVRNLALSVESRTKLLNELAPPVNIAYAWGIVSRDCDMFGSSRLYF
jgi:hypothetical protein